MSYKFTRAYSQYGANMGRPNSIREAATVKKLHFERVSLDSGGYDKGGAYWGFAEPLFVAWGEGESEQQEYFVRAACRETAKEEIQAIFPNARANGRKKNENS